MAKPYYEYEVPEGYTAMSLPTKPETRLSKDQIKIELCKEEDLEDWARCCYEAFPPLFWDKVEDAENRPPLPDRIKLLAKHFVPWLTQPGFYPIKAVHGETGEMLGIAGWHESGPDVAYPTSYKSIADANGPLTFPATFVPCAWHPGMYEELGMAQRMGWTADDIREMTWFRTPAYEKLFVEHDKGRLAEMGDAPHWYLAPICVFPKWNGRGVGSELMTWALDRADEKGLPVVLESMPGARPVYYRYGFEPTAHKGEFKPTQLVRPGQKKA